MLLCSGLITTAPLLEFNKDVTNSEVFPLRKFFSVNQILKYCLLYNYLLLNILSSLSVMNTLPRSSLKTKVASASIKFDPPRLPLLAGEDDASST